MKTIHLHGQPVAGGRCPLICTPLVGRLKDEVLRELAIILPKQPYVIEWRVDYFRNIADLAEVLEVAKCIRDAAGRIPILFSCRSASEGGETIPLDDAEVVGLHSALCESGLVDLIDYELHNPPEKRARLRKVSRDNDVAMILSYHNFQVTPDAAALAGKFADAERCGADIAKVAVMPRSPEDVLTLLGATWRASEAAGIPVIGMSMGGLGAVSRMASGVFGSALAFAVGESSSAPGQIPIEELRIFLEIMGAEDPRMTPSGMDFA
jgi:3-dehydroquinate dehydratase-1